MDELERIREYCPVSREALEKLALYRTLLLDWNTRMDLTSVKEGDVAARHFLDSLLPLAVPGLMPENARVIDVGTGAGFPGLPLAIARPDLRVTLLEAQGKRCRFLEAVIRELALENAVVINDRAENLGRADGHREAYGLAVARAVAPLNILLEYLLPFVETGGRALCWKGPAVAEEAEDGAAAARLLGGEMEPFIEIGAGERKNILVPVRKTEKTVPQYPRKNGVPAKRPLKSDRK